MRTLLLWLACLATLTACRTAQGAGGSAPFGTWSLTVLEGADVSHLLRRPELSLDEAGSLSGFSGVNRFQGALELEALGAGRLVAGPLAATRRAGPPEAMAVETRLFQVLGSPLEWRREGNQLVLLDGQTVVARLERVP